MIRAIQKLIQKSIQKYGFPKMLNSRNFLEKMTKSSQHIRPLRPMRRVRMKRHLANPRAMHPTDRTATQAKNRLPPPRSRRNPATSSTSISGFRGAPPSSRCCATSRYRKWNTDCAASSSSTTNPRADSTPPSPVCDVCEVEASATSKPTPAVEAATRRGRLRRRIVESA